MINYTIVTYYLAFNVAYMDRQRAETITFDYSHKGEYVKELYVIIENDNAPDSFITDSDGYLYFYQLQHAIDEIKQLQE